MSLITFIKKIPQKRKIQKLHQELVIQRRTVVQPSVQLQSQPRNNNKCIYKPFYLWFLKDGWAVLGIFLLVGITIWYFGFHQETFKMSHISITGTKFIHTEDIEHEIQSYQKSTILGVIHRDTYWTVHTQTIEKQLDAAFQQSFALERIQVEKKFPNSLSIIVTERIPSITWITSKSNQEQIYLIDRKGIVTKTLIKKEDADSAFPVIYDKNREQVKIGEQIISQSYIEFLLKIHEEFAKKNNLHIQQYELPPIQCQEKQYVAEKIFEQALSSSISDEYREKQKKIQEKFQKGELSIDESLEQLDTIKQEEIQKLAETDQKGSNLQKMQWEAVYVPIECDLTKVATELHLTTTDDSGSFTIYFDSSVDSNIQIENVYTVLQEKIPNKNAIQYIDVRIPDRIYYQ